MQAYRDWAADVRNAESRIMTSDVNAEYQLRKLEIPYHLVKAEIDVASKALVVLTQLLGEERLTEINDEMVEEYEDASQRRN